MMARTTVLHPSAYNPAMSGPFSSSLTPPTAPEEHVRRSSDPADSSCRHSAHQGQNRGRDDRARDGDRGENRRSPRTSAFVSVMKSTSMASMAPLNGSHQEPYEKFQSQTWDVPLTAEGHRNQLCVPSRSRPNSPRINYYGPEYIPMADVPVPAFLPIAVANVTTATTTVPSLAPGFVASGANGGGASCGMRTAAGSPSFASAAPATANFGTLAELRHQAATRRFVVTPVAQMPETSPTIALSPSASALTSLTVAGAPSVGRGTPTMYYPFEESHPLSTNSITMGSSDGRRLDVRKVLDPVMYDHVVYSSLNQRSLRYGEELADLTEDDYETSDDDDVDGPANGFDDAESRTPRQNWGTKLEFVLACIGYAVGLGNVWRFPYLAYKSGGGAFLVPYIVMLLVCGVPLMYMEFAVGQYTRRGPIQALDRLCPFFKGAGFGTVVISFLLCTYYNVIIAWALFYLFNSFRSRLPWSHCNNTYNSVWCVDTSESEEKFAVADGDGAVDARDGYAYNSTKFGIESRFVNCTSIAKHNWTIQAGNATAGILRSMDDEDSLSHLAYPRTPSEDFFFEGVLRISSGIDDPQAMRWELVLALIMAWVLVYFSIWKSVKSSGKVVYFTALFPYLVMIVFLVSALNLPGARDGVMYLIRPNWDFLWDADVWINAASQTFNSVGIGFGSLIAFASYNQYQNSILKDTMTVATVNALTSIVAGIIVFATLGNLSHEQGKCIDDIVSDGPGLVFVVYPQALNKMPMPTLWATMFFFMLMCLGLDSQFAMVEVVVTSLTDAYSKEIKRWLKKHEFLVLVVCSLSFVFGLPNVTEGGIYFFQLIDHYAAKISIMYITFFEVIAVCWFYGAGRLARNCLEMTGELPSLYFQVCWWFAAPLLIAIIWVYSLYESESVQYNNGRYAYPAWAEYFGWFIAAVSIIPIPVQAAIAVYEAKGNTFTEKLRESLQSRITICPTCGSDLLCKTGRMRIGRTTSEEGSSSGVNTGGGGAAGGAAAVTGAGGGSIKRKRSTSSSNPASPKTSYRHRRGSSYNGGGSRAGRGSARDPGSNAENANSRRRSSTRRSEDSLDVGGASRRKPSRDVSLDPSGSPRGDDLESQSNPCSPSLEEQGKTDHGCSRKGCANSVQASRDRSGRMDESDALVTNNEDDEDEDIRLNNTLDCCHVANENGDEKPHRS